MTVSRHYNVCFASIVIIVVCHCVGLASSASRIYHKRSIRFGNLNHRTDQVDNFHVRRSINEGNVQMHPFMQCRSSEDAPWEQWSSCNAQCGVGIRERYRFAIESCVQKLGLQSYEKEKCYAKKVCPECKSEPWSSWDSCDSVMCGRRAVTTRSRITRKLKIQTCVESPVVESKYCKFRYCDTGCVTSEWSATLQVVYPDDYRKARIIKRRHQLQEATSPTALKCSEVPKLLVEKCKKSNCAELCQVNEWSEWSNDCDCAKTGAADTEKLANETHVRTREMQATIKNGCAFFQTEEIESCRVYCINNMNLTSNSTTNLADSQGQLFSGRNLQIATGLLIALFVVNGALLLLCYIKCNNSNKVVKKKNVRTTNTSNFELCELAKERQEDENPSDSERDKLPTEWMEENASPRISVWSEESDTSDGSAPWPRRVFAQTTFVPGRQYTVE